ncbi:MAG: hypothetical protein HY270_08420 [Deltaproteobacteria bacterium]|nr:hypothetical protein [Deltaproteobacteria bacterium]
MTARKVLIQCVGHASLGLAALILLAVPVFACDICAVYTATELQESRTGLHLGVAEQFSHFGTLQQSGHAVDNPRGERVDSSITQFLLGYRPLPRLGLQVNLPLIDRDYRRVETKGTVSGSEVGIGDAALSASGLLYDHVDDRHVIRLSGLFGIKLPTGNSHRLKEELEPAGSSGDPSIPPIFQNGHRRWEPQHTTGVRSGVHGHDLVLGSGSADLLVGGQLLATQQRLFLTAAVQYSIRTAGSFGYQFANELSVTGGPGMYVLLAHNYSLAVQAVLTTETKGNDSTANVRASDTAITALYAGPGVHFTWESSLSAELVADLPAIQNNSSLQIVPDYRLRGGWVWRF